MGEDESPQKRLTAIFWTWRDLNGQCDQAAEEDLRQVDDVLFSVEHSFLLDLEVEELRSRTEGTATRFNRFFLQNLFATSRGIALV